MSGPLGDFIRARRDETAPESVGLPPGHRRRAPGLRRSELAALAGISVEYLVRIEQGRDRNPSLQVINALADALRLGPEERGHLKSLAKLATGGQCTVQAADNREVRPTVRKVLEQLEPGAAFVTNRLGDVLAHTSGFALVAGPTGLLDSPRPNLTRYVFTDPRARTVLVDWDAVADQCAADLWLGPQERATALAEELSAAVGEEFTSRAQPHRLPRRGAQRWRHPEAGELRLVPEVLELPVADSQQLVVLVPADEATASALDQLRLRSAGALRAVT